MRCLGNTDDACSASYLAIDTLNGIRTRNAAPVLPRKRHERQRITEPILQNLHRFTARFLVLRPERFIRGERGFGIRLVIDALQIAGELFLVRLRRMRRYVASESAFSLARLQPGGLYPPIGPVCFVRTSPPSLNAGAA